MPSNKPIHLLNGIRELSTSELENRLRNHLWPAYIEYKWTQKAIENGVFFDLSKLKFANMGAAAQLVLLIESAVKAGVPIFVALPTSRLTKSESESIKMNFELKAKILKSREDVGSFLQTIGFTTAVRCDHLLPEKKVELTNDFEFASKEKPLNITEFRRAFKTGIVNSRTTKIRLNYRFILPMTWLDSQATEIDDGFETSLSEILGNQDRGLEHIDVKAIRNVVMSELLKNVREHAGTNTRYALFGIGLMPKTAFIKSKPEEGDKKPNGLHDIDQSFLEWLADSETENMIEIYFGDSGDGLLSDELRGAYTARYDEHLDLDRKKDKLELLKWAFNKWSTRKVTEEIRGTKGLYRINRIINKYNGLFLIRTNEVCGGFQKGGFSSAQWVNNLDDFYSTIPGTFVNLKLCPYREISKFTFKFKKHNVKRNWKVVFYELSSYDTLEFDKWLLRARDLQSNDNVLLILRNKIDTVAESAQKFLAHALLKLSYIRHPNGLVVYSAIDVGEIALELLVNSTDSLLEDKKDYFETSESVSEDHELVYDPILVIGKGLLAWFGGNKMILNILNEMYVTPSDGRRLSELQTYLDLTPAEKIQVYQHFQNDDSLVTISENEEIEFNFTNINDLFSSYLEKKLEASASAKSNITCTPRLHVVKQWYDVQTLLKNPVDLLSFAFSMYLQAAEAIGSQKLNSNTYILIDHHLQKELAIQFATLIGVEPRNIVNAIDDIDNSIPRRTVLFNKGDQVIILTTVISTSETIRRLVKYVKRDLATPLCIICLANLRETSMQSLDTWGEKTQIISVYQKHLTSLNPDEKRKVGYDKSHFNQIYTNVNTATAFIGPDYQTESKTSKPKDHDIASLPIELRNHLVDNKALYYSHYGRYSGRHFTFYLNKQRVLEERSLIWIKYLEFIEQWMKEHSIEDFVIVRPTSSKDENESLDNCLNYLSNKFGMKGRIIWNADKSAPLKGYENIVFVDFGILTGENISKFLSNVRDAQNILICIAFAQYQHNDFQYYERLRTLSIPLGKNPVQMTLFSEAELNNFHIPDTTLASISVKSIFSLPFDYYNSTTCPICEHERALDTYRFPSTYMDKFSNDRKRRLKIRGKEMLDKYPCDFYATLEDDFYELSSSLIMKMYDLKQCLTKALTSTQHRIRIYNFLHRIYQSLDAEVCDSGSDLYATVYLLSNEVNWLQKEPLVFKEIRELLSELALAVAKLPLAPLSTQFSGMEGLNNNGVRVLIRYKYAAITVLRSSQKLKFCSNIAVIVKAAEFNGILSNNLFQNTFYHIGSLYKNSYNRSIGYFDTLEGQFNQLLDVITLMRPEQVETFNRALAENKKNKRRLAREQDGEADVSIIRSLISDFLEAYNAKNRHPVPARHFELLDFRSLGINGDALKDFCERKAESIFMEDVLAKAEMLLSDWKIVEEFLDDRVLDHLNSLSGDLFGSEVFSTLEENLIKFEEIRKPFKQQIADISQDCLKLIEHNEVYHRHIDFINELFISFAAKGHEGSNSKVLSVIQSFPSTPEHAIAKHFRSREFKSLAVKTNGLGHIDVFYSKTQLHYYLEHIKKNIENKKNPGISLKDINMEIEFAERNSQIILTLLYDGTERHSDNNSTGGLSHFKRDLSRFGGHVDYELRADGYFFIEIKFLKYEEGI